MSLLFLKPCRMSIGSMSHVEFKKWPCRPVEFKGQGPVHSVGALDKGVPMPLVDFKK